MNKLIGLFLILATSSMALENPCGIMIPRGIDEDWGSGLLFLPDSAELNLYAIQADILEATIIREGNFLYLLAKNGEKSSVVLDDIEWVGYTAMLGLKAKPNGNDYQVLWHGSGGGLWITQSELAAIGGRYYSYKELLFTKELNPQLDQYREWASIGVNLQDQCLNLRAGPSTTHKKISCISSNDWAKSDDYTQLDILRTDGDWAEVLVSTFSPNEEASEGGDCDYIKTAEQRGWIKALDQSGFPNIWFSVSSY